MTAPRAPPREVATAIPPSRCATKEDTVLSPSRLRLAVPFLVTGLAAAALAGAGSLPRAGAQDAATPAVAAPASWSIPGIAVLGAMADPSYAPGMVLELDRITWAPGFAVPMHYHPAQDVIFVLSGEVAWSVEGGTAQVVRAAAAGTPGPTEELRPGGEAVLGPGDVILFDYPETGMRHAARVVGDAPVVMLDAVLYDPDQPLTEFPEGVTPVSEG
jgi:mannose-6-phosphate isomerase-like protein (cupin superfamily)